MKRGYIPVNTTATEVIQLIQLYEQRGVCTDEITINQSFPLFLESVNNHDTVIVPRYGSVCGSLPELFSQIIELWDRQIVLESLFEPTLADSQERIGLVSQLHELGRHLQATRTKQGLSKARAEGKKLGRPQGSCKMNPRVQTAHLLPLPGTNSQNRAGKPDEPCPLFHIGRINRIFAWKQSAK